jgi:hypothetical protein
MPAIEHQLREAADIPSGVSMSRYVSDIKNSKPGTSSSITQELLTTDWLLSS